MIRILIPVIILITALLIQVKSTVDAQSETKIYKAKCDSIQHVADSLHYELFPVQIELGRYQVAYDIFMERNPKAASQYGDIISNETE